jgi:hypothetical protein
VLNTLSLINSALVTLPIIALPALRYPTFDNHGSVLNLQGFPGGVKVTGSTFKNNLVFIPDIFPSKRSVTDEVELFDYYKNKVTGQIRTTRCSSNSVKKRLLSDYLTSLSEQPS